MATHDHEFAVAADARVLQLADGRVADPASLDPASPGPASQLDPAAGHDR
jgi:hypothetical protein